MRFQYALQNLINELQVDTVKQAETDPVFLSRLYRLYLKDGDIAELLVAAFEASETAFMEWARGQDSVLGTARKETDRALGVVLSESLRETVFADFENYWSERKVSGREDYLRSLEPVGEMYGNPAYDAIAADRRRGIG